MCRYEMDGLFDYFSNVVDLVRRRSHVETMANDSWEKRTGCVRWDKFCKQCPANDRHKDLKAARQRHIS